MDDLIDCDANLTHEALSTDAAQHILAANAAGVKQFVVPGTSLTASEAVLRFAASQPAGTIISCVGVHPYEAERVGPPTPAALERLRALAEGEAEGLPIRARAIGECGLDALIAAISVPPRPASPSKPRARSASAPSPARCRCAT